LERSVIDLIWKENTQMTEKTPRISSHQITVVSATCAYIKISLKMFIDTHNILGTWLCTRSSLLCKPVSLRLVCSSYVVSSHDRWDM